jgi:hypothetical protein
MINYVMSIINIDLKWKCQSLWIDHKNTVSHLNEKGFKDTEHHLLNLSVMNS